ncbi:MAG TPA: alpha/beta fold hydrolase [Jatrophihabitans sp.]|nr:alpha/beta fold hydrolase [Jatrophihabitans sp.]
MTAPRLVTSADAVRLAVYESGGPEHPPIVAVHGFPDNHRVWDGVVDLLRIDHHVITYDVRGAGASDRPTGRLAYRNDRLTDDLIAVLDAVSPDEPVHLLGHDWGSIQIWPALTDPRLAGRVASFTSISGPSLDHAAAWLRQLRRHPVASLRQLAHSYYLFLFQLPVLPEAAIRRGGLRRAVVAAGGRAPEDGDTLSGLWLYRANVLPRVARPAPTPISVPVQVVVPDRDPFATPQLAREAPVPWVAQLTVHDVKGGHWIVAQRPDVIADLVRTFVRGIAQ